MLVDEAEIVLKAGHGGAGKVSFFPGKKAGPDGGNGGRGGDVYLHVTTDITALGKFTTMRTLAAENGYPGGSNKKDGKAGDDMIVKIPMGSLVRILETGDEFEILNQDEKILISKGGLGGRGNFEMRSSRRTTPTYAQPGLPGEQKTLKIILRLIADIGFIGLPNAGKSSLLNELTNARAKVAGYPFTTLEPNLGVMDGLVLADIPGLIEGASQGRGLGVKFLKHIEKTRVLVHAVAADGQNPESDYYTVRRELASFNPELSKKQEIVLLTKSDLLSDEEKSSTLAQLKRISKSVLAVSIHDWDSLKKLSTLLLKSCRRAN